MNDGESDEEAATHPTTSMSPISSRMHTDDHIRSF